MSRSGLASGLMESENVIGAFSEQQAASISGLSLYQIRQWNKHGLIRPAFEKGKEGTPYARLYSFRDLVSLQILDDLRNHKKVPLAHLRDVASSLRHFGDERWIATTLYVLGKRVVFENPKTSQREEVVSKQRVFDIPLRVVARNTREKIRRLSDRSDRTGEIEKRRMVSGNRRVFAGTRIPVSGVIDFLRAGYPPEAVLKEFPDLTLRDIEAAAAEMNPQAA